MFRLSKVTDYGIVLLAHLAQSEEQSAHNARDIAGDVGLPAPMVSKILKALARHGVLESQRGSKGGYQLARRPEQLTVADMISALEGPVGLTECTLGTDLCVHEGSCAVQTPWQVINRVIRESLDCVTLADLIDPSFSNAMSTDEILGRVTVLPTRTKSGSDEPANLE